MHCPHEECHSLRVITDPAKDNSGRLDDVERIWVQAQRSLDMNYTFKWPTAKKCSGQSPVCQSIRIVLAYFDCIGRPLSENGEDIVNLLRMAFASGINLAEGFSPFLRLL